ncbi:hypothetical protein HK097_006898 [Rhizophlyctis rosea]|uniref:Uncharacterized protein n=1 Tax=Rhizophlyctis rosea TaxID=64517 RepID=A0AAD5SCU1_9FUNG|nr:hypothetical protein HK097_006898 [Rhizophlyctis rosea]
MRIGHRSVAVNTSLKPEQYSSGLRGNPSKPQGHYTLAVILVVVAGAAFVCGVGFACWRRKRMARETNTCTIVSSHSHQHPAAPTSSAHSISGLSASIASTTSVTSKCGTLKRWYLAFRRRILAGKSWKVEKPKSIVPVIEKKRLEKLQDASEKGQDSAYSSSASKWSLAAHPRASLTPHLPKPPSITSIKTYPAKSIDTRSQGRASIYSGYSDTPIDSPSLFLHNLPESLPDISTPAVNFSLPRSETFPHRASTATAPPPSTNTTSLNRPESTKSSIASVLSTKAASTTALFSGTSNLNINVSGTGAGGPRSDAGTLTSTRAIHAPSIVSGRSGRVGGDYVSVVTAWSFGEKSVETGREKEKGADGWSVRDRETESLNS